MKQAKNFSVRNKNLRIKNLKRAKIIEKKLLFLLNINKKTHLSIQLTDLLKF